MKLQKDCFDAPDWLCARCLIADCGSSTSSLERRHKGGVFLFSRQLNFCGVSAYPGSGLSSQSGICRCIMSSENGSRNVSKRSAPGWGCSERNAVSRLGVPADAPLPSSSGSWVIRYAATPSASKGLPVRNIAKSVTASFRATATFARLKPTFSRRAVPHRFRALSVFARVRMWAAASYR